MSLLLKVVAEVTDPVMASFELGRVQDQQEQTRIADVEVCAYSRRNTNASASPHCNSKRFMTSIPGRIDQERTAAMKKLRAEVAERPGYNELGDPRAVETEREETQWNR